MEEKKLTAKQYLKENPDQHVMVTHEFGTPIYVAPLKDLLIQVTPNKEEAELWSELDKSPSKLGYYVAVTGYKVLKFEKV